MEQWLEEGESAKKIEKAEKERAVALSFLSSGAQRQPLPVSLEKRSRSRMAYRFFS
ncbi:MAG: hypothetical protein IJ221_07955 [Oscillibacter sp.]|nr:hypothetical protein [Oscillibacter sp.]